MKRYWLLLLSVLPVVCFAQQKYTVTGEGKAFKDGYKMYLCYTIDNRTKLDSTVVVNNRFKFSGQVPGITSVTLYTNENPMLIEYSHGAISFYLEAGTISISAPDSLKIFSISGTPTNTDMMDLKVKLNDLTQRDIKLATDFEALSAADRKSIDRVAKFRASTKQVREEMLPIQLAFIKEHNNSYISLMTIEQILRYKEAVGQAYSAYASLTPSLKQTPKGMQVGKVLSALTQTSTGVMAADFTLPDVNGLPFTLSDLKGKYVLLDFWASWCGPCRAENPFVVSAYQKFKNKGFTVVSVSLDDAKTKKAWLKAIKDDGLAWTHLSDLKGWKNEAAVRYGITSIPANVLIDPSGKIIGSNLKDQVLHNRLAELLDGPAK